jgi:two-component system chemotaxis response regulator CheB
MRVQRVNSEVTILLDQGPREQSVRPAVDPLFTSLAVAYRGDCAAFVLTGMGEDGLRGCTALKQVGAGIVVQSAESCVVFGMPGAVYRAGLPDRVGNLEQIRALLQRMVAAMPARDRERAA